MKFGANFQFFQFLNKSCQFATVCPFCSWSSFGVPFEVSLGVDTHSTPHTLSLSIKGKHIWCGTTTTREWNYAKNEVSLLFGWYSDPQKNIDLKSLPITEFCQQNFWNEVFFKNVYYELTYNCRVWQFFRRFWYL